MYKLKTTAMWITLLALIVKIAGFLRESIIAKQFGANHQTDGYLLAFSFITLIIAMISGGFNNVFLPQYIKSKKEAPLAAEKNANGILNGTVVIFLLLTIPGFLCVPYLLPVIFGTMTAQTEKVAVEITQFFFLFMSGIALNGILESYLQGRRIFVPSQISKLLATLMGAIFSLLVSEQFGMSSLAYGFVFGTTLGIIIQFFYLWKSGFHWKATIKMDKSFLIPFLTLLIPALLNSVVGQINMFVNKIFAAGTIAGAITYLNNASLLVSIPQSIYGTTIATIIFTLLSEQAEDPKKFQQTVFTGLQISFLTLMPVAIGLFLIGEAAISFVFERGQFTAEDTTKTYIALLWYLPLIVTQGLQYIISKSMYAKGKTGVIFRISVTTIALNFLFNWMFVKRFSYPGLALTSSLVSIYYLAVTTFIVYKDFEKGESIKLARMFIRGMLPAFTMMLSVYLMKEFSPVSEWSSLAQLGILVPLGVIFYGVGVFVFYREGVEMLVGIFRRDKSVYR